MPRPMREREIVTQKWDSTAVKHCKKYLRYIILFNLQQWSFIGNGALGTAVFSDTKSLHLKFGHWQLLNNN